MPQNSNISLTLKPQADRINDARTVISQVTARNQWVHPWHQQVRNALCKK